jgi:hypothetical protein
MLAPSWVGQVSRSLMKNQAGCTALIDKIAWEVVTCEIPWWLAVKASERGVARWLAVSHRPGFPDYATAMIAEAGMSQSPVSSGFS